MCARVQTDVLRVLRVLRVPVFQFCMCLWRRVFGVPRVLCVLLGLCVLYALCALYAFSKPYVQHRWPQKRASGQKRTNGRQRKIYWLFPRCADVVTRVEMCITVARYVCMARACLIRPTPECITEARDMCMARACLIAPHVSALPTNMGTQAYPRHKHTPQASRPHRK